MSDKQLTFRCVDPSGSCDGLFLSNFGPLHPENCCEFVRERVYFGASGRKCVVDGFFCPERIYADKLIYFQCFLRIRELAHQKKLEEQR